MAAWWQPTADAYFLHISKAMILDAVGEFAPDQVGRLEKLKKAEIASEAERLVVGTGWMPVVFRREAGQDDVNDSGESGDALTA
jgi:ParB family chromosome partitioning protein